MIFTKNKRYKTVYEQQIYVYMFMLLLNIMTIITILIISDAVQSNLIKLHVISIGSTFLTEKL